MLYKTNADTTTLLERWSKELAVGRGNSLYAEEKLKKIISTLSSSQVQSYTKNNTSLHTLKIHEKEWEKVGP